MCVCVCVCVCVCGLAIGVVGCGDSPVGNYLTNITSQFAMQFFIRCETTSKVVTENCDAV